MAVSYRFIGDINKGKTLIGEANRQLFILYNAMRFQELKQLSRVTDYPDGSRIVCESIFGIDTVWIKTPYAPAVEEKKVIKKRLVNRPVFLIGLGVYERPEGITEGGQYAYDPERFNPQRLLLFDPKIEGKYGIDSVIFTGITPVEMLNRWNIDIFYPIQIGEQVFELPWGMILRDERNKNPGANYPLCIWLNTSSDYLDDIYRFRYRSGSESAGQEFEIDEEYPNTINLVTPPSCSQNCHASASDLIETHCAYSAEATRYRFLNVDPYPEEAGRYTSKILDDYKKLGRRVGGSTSLETQTDLNFSFGYIHTVYTTYGEHGSDHDYGSTPETAVMPFQSWYNNYYREYKVTCSLGTITEVNLLTNLSDYWIGYPTIPYPGVGTSGGNCAPSMLGGPNGGSFTLNLAKVEQGHIYIAFAMAGSMATEYPAIPGTLQSAGCSWDDTNPSPANAQMGIIAKWDIYNGDNPESVDYFNPTKDRGLSSAVNTLVDDFYLNVMQDPALYIADSSIVGKVIIQETEVTTYEDGTESFIILGYKQTDKMHFIG